MVRHRVWIPTAANKTFATIKLRLDPFFSAIDAFLRSFFDSSLVRHSANIENISAANRSSTRSGARHSCCPLENSPIFPRGVAYDLGHVGSPSVESLFALRMELVPLIDSRNA